MNFRRFLMSSLLLLSFVTSSFGIKIVSQNSGGGGEFDCSEIIIFDIVVANLTQNHDGNYYLPDGYPEMYFQYEVGLESGFSHLATFEPYIDQEENLTLYKSTVMVIIWYDDYCLSSEDEAEVPITISVRKSNGDYYPIDEMYLPGDIFSCNIFDFTECLCPGNCPYVSLPPIPEWSGSHTIECEGCKNRRSVEVTGAHLTQMANISPNPFTADFVFEAQIEDATDIELNILDTNGKVIKSIIDNAPEGIYRNRIFTENWPGGLYFVQAKIGDQVQTYRIVKMN